MLALLRHILAEARDLLIRNGAANSKELKKNATTCNSALSFTSMNADLDRRYANEMHGAYAFRIYGSVHHLISPELIPSPSNIVQQPRFAQIYIFESANELQNRMNVAGNPDVRPETMLLLQDMMHRVNPFADLFKTMEEIDAEQPNGIRNIRMIFRGESSPDPRRYNAPTVDEIGVLIVGGEDKGSVIPTNRDIVMRLRGGEEANGLERINELNQRYDPLQYVLMFPHGDLGWNINIKSFDPDRMEEIEEGEAVHPVDRNNAEVSVMQYYSSRLMVRFDSDCRVPVTARLYAPH